LMSVAMLSAALSGKKKYWEELGKAAGWMKSALKQNDFISQAAQRYRYMDRTVVLGRGFNYSTAFEWALKLKELTYIIAEPYSSADFAHGPIAMVDSGFPVLAVAPKGKVFQTMLEALRHLKKDFGAELVVISNDQRALSLAQVPLTIPAETPEWLSPLVSILPAQLFAYHLTLAKGCDPERPRMLRKVTETR